MRDFEIEKEMYKKAVKLIEKSILQAGAEPEWCIQQMEIIIRVLLLIQPMNLLLCV